MDHTGDDYEISLPLQPAVIPDEYGRNGEAYIITINDRGIITSTLPTTRSAPIIESPDGTILIDQIEDVTLLSMVPNIVTPGTYGSSSTAAQFTVDTYGRVTAASTNNLPTLSSSTLTVAGGPAYTANLTVLALTPGTYGSGTQVPRIVVDQYGRITGVISIPIIQPTIPTVSSSTLSVTGAPDYEVNLNSGIVTPGTYGDATNIPSLTVDTYGRVTAATTNAISTLKDLWLWFSPTNHGSGTPYFWGMGYAENSATPLRFSTPCPVTGTIVEMFFSVDDTTLTGIGASCTLWMNNSATANVVTIPAGSLQATQAVSVAVNKNDKLAVRFVSTAIAYSSYCWLKIQY